MVKITCRKTYAYTRRRSKKDASLICSRCVLQIVTSCCTKNERRRIWSNGSSKQKQKLQPRQDSELFDFLGSWVRCGSILEGIKNRFDPILENFGQGFRRDLERVLIALLANTLGSSHCFFFNIKTNRNYHPFSNLGDGQDNV